MRYKSIFSISFDADDDAAATTIAHKHHAQVRDELQVEGADHPYDITLEQVLAIALASARPVLPEPEKKAI